MNFGNIIKGSEGIDTECLYVNTLPNNTILVQYNEAGEVCKIVNKLKELDISYSRNKPYNFIPDYLLGKKGYTEFSNISNGTNLCIPGEFTVDYSPVVYMFTNRGEYGYSQLTVYMSDISDSIVLAYEHQYKGDIVIRYFIENI